MKFQGITPKIEEKIWISRGSICKKWKAPGGHGKFDWKSRGVNFKKIDILNRGGGTIFFWKSPFYSKCIVLITDKKFSGKIKKTVNDIWFICKHTFIFNSIIKKKFFPAVRENIFINYFNTYLYKDLLFLVNSPQRKIGRFYSVAQMTGYNWREAILLDTHYIIRCHVLTSWWSYLLFFLVTVDCLAKKTLHIKKIKIYFTCCDVKNPVTNLEFLSYL